MKNKKQDWRTTDSGTKSTSRDQSQRNTSTAPDDLSSKHLAGKKPMNSDVSSKKASAGRQSDDLSSRDSSRR